MDENTEVMAQHLGKGFVDLSGIALGPQRITELTLYIENADSMLERMW